MTPPYNDLFHAFSIALSSCWALIVIGYSWSDFHINRQIEHEIARGMKIMEVSLFDGEPSPSKPPLPEDTVQVRARAKQALAGKPVDVRQGTGEWTRAEKGLIEVAQKLLHTQFWKTDEEWHALRAKAVKKRR